MLNIPPFHCTSNPIMLRSRPAIISIAALGLLLAGINATAQEPYQKAFPVEPDRYYRLTFEVGTPPAEGAPVKSWVLHQFNAMGEQPFDGTFEWAWQRLQPGQTVYRHEFLTTGDATEVRLGFRGGGSALSLIAATLTPTVVTNYVLNGDFALGPGNHSGWSQMKRAAIIGDTDAGMLRVSLNGYALTDHFLVESGGGCTFLTGAKTWPGVTLLAYDRQRRLIDTVPYVRTNSPPIRLPDGAVYGRLLFNTSHDHIPSFCTNDVPFTGLVRQGEPLPGGQVPTPLPRAEEEIVLAPGSDPREVYAARELRHWIARITGHLPPLLAVPSSRQNVKLVVGAPHAGAFADDLAWLGDSDGYAVRRQGSSIYIFGTKPRGTIYGVHAFLERNSDIIWPRPNPDFEAVFTPSPQLVYAAADFRSRPTFAMRFISRASAGDFRFQDWMARNGLNTGFLLHTGFNYLLWERGAPSGYGHSHLTWIGAAANLDNTLYPMIDGERQISTWRQPCYTHPEVASIIAGAIRRALERVPESPAENISSIIADNWGVCACPRCMEPIVLPDGSTLAPKSAYSNNDPLFFSTRNFMMLNAVAEDLARDYPDIKLVTHAYIFTAEPPLVKLHPMILPQFAAYPTQNARFPITSGKGQILGEYTADIWKRRFEAWGLWHPQGLGFFGYYYTPGFNAMADTAAADFRDLASFGGIQAHTEGYPFDGAALSAWDVDGAEKWAMARLMWNPYQDPAELRTNYIGKVYREGAPQMAAFHTIISNGWHDAGSSLFVNCHSTVRDLYEGLLVKPGREQEARDLLVQAVAAAQHPLSRRLAERTLAHFDLYRDQQGRHVVPYVAESSQEWNDAVSPHWEKALVVSRFLRVTDWQRFNDVPADPQTEVRFMHDGTRLYIRAVAHDPNPDRIVAPPHGGTPVFPNGDRVEFMVAAANGAERHFLAVGPNENRYASPGMDHPWEIATSVREDDWVAMVALPLAEFGATAAGGEIRLRPGRVYRHAIGERQESTPAGASLFNLHESFWMNLIIE